MNNSAAKVGEIFREAGTAFNKLSEMTMLLHSVDDSTSGETWTNEDIELLRSCVNRFAVDLNKISHLIKDRTMSPADRRMLDTEVKNEIVEPPVIPPPPPPIAPLLIPPPLLQSLPITLTPLPPPISPLPPSPPTPTLIIVENEDEDLLNDFDPENIPVVPPDEIMQSNERPKRKRLTIDIDDLPAKRINVDGKITDMPNMAENFYSMPPLQPNMQVGFQPYMHNIQVSPQASMQMSPQHSMQMSPQLSMQMSPQLRMPMSRQPNLQAISQPSMQMSPQRSMQMSSQLCMPISHQSSMQMSPQPSLQASSQPSTQMTSQLSMPMSHHSSMQMSPQRSMQMSPQRSMQMSSQLSMPMSPQLSMSMSPQLSMQANPEPYMQVGRGVAIPSLLDVLPTPAIPQYRFGSYHLGLPPISIYRRPDPPISVNTYVNDYTMTSNEFNMQNAYQSQIPRYSHVSPFPETTGYNSSPYFDSYNASGIDENSNQTDNTFSNYSTPKHLVETITKSENEKEHEDCVTKCRCCLKNRHARRSARQKLSTRRASNSNDTARNLDTTSPTESADNTSDGTPSPEDSTKPH